MVRIAPKPAPGIAAPVASRTGAVATEHVNVAAFNKITAARGRLEREWQSLVSKTPKSEFRVARPLEIGVLCLGGMGGSGLVARDAAAAYAASGHRTHLLSAGTFFDDHELENISVAAVDVPTTPIEPTPEWTGKLARQIVDYVRKNGIQLLNVHYVAGLLDAAIQAKKELAAEGYKLSVAATLHGTDVTNWGAHPVHGPALKAQLEAADAVSAVSHVLAEQAQRIVGLDHLPTVISNAIDPLRFNPGQWSNIRQRIAPNGEFVLCHVSNLREVKRPLDVVEIFASVKKSGVPTKLLIVGDGPLLPAMYDRAMALGVADDIVVVGPQDPDKLPQFVAAADLMLVTSENESFCLAALEAMAMGVPVVGTHCGGLDEVMSTIDPGVDRASRLLANVGDTKTMAKVCRELLRDPNRYKRIQRQGIRLPLRTYPRDLQVQGYLMLADHARPSTAR